jgi:hypothetical protein
LFHWGKIGRKREFSDEEGYWADTAVSLVWFFGSCVQKAIRTEFTPGSCSRLGSNADLKAKYGQKVKEGKPKMCHQHYTGKAN